MTFSPALSHSSFLSSQMTPGLMLGCLVKSKLSSVLTAGKMSGHQSLLVPVRVALFDFLGEQIIKLFARRHPGLLRSVEQFGKMVTDKRKL